MLRGERRRPVLVWRRPPCRGRIARLRPRGPATGGSGTGAATPGPPCYTPEPFHEGRVTGPDAPGGVDHPAGQRAKVAADRRRFVPGRDTGPAG